MRKRSFWILGFIIIIGFTPVLPIVFSHPHGKGKAKAKGKVKEISVFLDYTDSPMHTNDYPVVGIPYIVYDGLNAVIGDGTTDSLGMMTFIVLASYNQDDLGVHITFMWQGALVSIDNLVGGAIRNVEVNDFDTTFTFLWEDLTPIIGENVDMWFNGVKISGLLTNGAGSFSLNHLVDGVYTFKSANALFDDVNYTILVDTSVLEIFADIIVSAKFERISRYLVNKTGILFFYNR